MGLLSLTVNLICGFFAFSTLGYLCLFVVGHTVLLPLTPTEYQHLFDYLVSVDHKPDWNNLSIVHSLPALNNALLVALFGLQHSAMQRGPFKKLKSLLLPESLHRSSYVLGSGLALCALYLFWIPMTAVIWEFSNPVLILMVNITLLLSLFGTLLTILNFDPFHLLGIKSQTKETKSERKSTLVTTGVYGWVRHPMYACSLFLLWVTPSMSLGHLWLSVSFSFYVWFAVTVYEEPSLVKEFGPAYVEYMKTTPAFIPNLLWFLRPKAKKQ